MESTSRDSTTQKTNRSSRTSVPSRNSVTVKKLKTVKLESYYPLFNKDPALRNPKENKKLTRIIESLTFFNKEHLSMIYQNQLMDTLLSRLHYEAFEPSKAIYHEGDTSSSFYIVLKGRIRLFIPRSSEDIDKDRSLAQNQHLNTPASAFQKNLVVSSPAVASKKSPWFKSKDSAALLGSPALSLFRSNSKQSAHFQPPPDSSVTLGSKPPQSIMTKNNMLSPNLPRSLSKEKNNNASVNHSRNDSGADLSKLKVENNQLPQRSLFKKSVAKLSVVTSFSHQQLRAQPTNSLINNDISVEDQQLLAQISQLNRKYILNDGVCRFRAHRDLNAGEGFGEITNKANARQETAVAIESLHVLTLSAEDYLEIFEEPIRERKERIGIFRKIFSDNQNNNFLSRFAELFQAKKYEFKDIIYHQGTPAGGLYMVTKGEVVILKTETYRLDSSPRKFQKNTSHKHEVARLASYRFFGAEELLGLEKRTFTAECASMELEVLFLDLSFISEPFFYTKNFLATITTMCEVQHQWEMNHLEEIKERIDGKNYNTNEKNTLILKREYQPVYKEYGVKKNLDEKYKVRRFRPATALANKDKRINDSHSNESMHSSTNQNTKGSLILTQETRPQTPIQTLQKTKNELRVAKIDSEVMESFILYRDTSDSMNFELKLTKKKYITEEVPVNQTNIPLGSKTSLWKRNIELISPRLRHTNISPLSRFSENSENLHLSQTKSTSRNTNINNATTIHIKTDLRSFVPLQTSVIQRTQLSSRDMQITSPVLAIEKSPSVKERDFIKNKLKLFLHAVNNQPIKRYSKITPGASLLKKYMQQLRNKEF